MKSNLIDIVDYFDASEILILMLLKDDYLNSLHMGPGVGVELNDIDVKDFLRYNATINHSELSLDVYSKLNLLLLEPGDNLFVATNVGFSFSAVGTFGKKVAYDSSCVIEIVVSYVDPLNLRIACVVDGCYYIENVYYKSFTCLKFLRKYDKSSLDIYVHNMIEYRKEKLLAIAPHITNFRNLSPYGNTIDPELSVDYLSGVPASDDLYEISLQDVAASPNVFEVNVNNDFYGL